MPYGIQVETDEFFERPTDGILHSQFIRVDGRIATLDLLHRNANQIHDARLNVPHARGQFQLHFNHFGFVLVKGVQHGGLEAWPEVELADKEIPHDAFHAPEARREGVWMVGEAFDEAGAVALTVQPEYEGLLGRFGDFVGAVDEDAGDVVDGHAVAQEIHHQNAGTHEDDSTLQIQGIPKKYE